MFFPRLIGLRFLYRCLVWRQVSVLFSQCTTREVAYCSSLFESACRMHPILRRISFARLRLALGTCPRYLPLETFGYRRLEYTLEYRGLETRAVIAPAYMKQFGPFSHRYSPQRSRMADQCDQLRGFSKCRCRAYDQDTKIKCALVCSGKRNMMLVLRSVNAQTTIFSPNICWASIVSGLYQMCDINMCPTAVRPVSFLP